MVEDTGDHDPISFDQIKDAVAAIEHAAYSLTVIQPLFPAMRKPPKALKNLVERLQVAACCINAELFRTVSIDFGQIGIGSYAEPDLNHACRDDWR